MLPDLNNDVTFERRNPLTGAVASTAVAMTADELARRGDALVRSMVEEVGAFKIRKRRFASPMTLSMALPPRYLRATSRAD